MYCKPTFKKIILLKRDPDDKNIVTKLNTDEALQYLLAHDFCNPHQLVRDKRKIELRTELARLKTLVAAGGSIDNPTRIRELRKTVARLLTIEAEGTGGKKK